LLIFFAKNVNQENSQNKLKLTISYNFLIWAETNYLF